jgi:hypothetical protein
MTYTINEHLINSSIADKDMFMVFSVPNNRIDNLHLIGRWFTRNPQTHFRYIQGRLKDKISKLNSELLKTLYPNVRFITTIDNPWCRLYHYYTIKKKSVSLTNFIKILPHIPNLSINILDNYPPDDSIIILRNEYINDDFAKFSKSSNATFLDTEPIDYRNFFDPESNNIIQSIFQKDIKFFYPELLS